MIDVEVSVQLDSVAWVHVKLRILVAQVVVMGVLVALQVALVPGAGLVAFARGQVHVVCVVVALLALTRCLGLFCVLIEAKHWQHNDLVVEQCARSKQHEANDSLPFKCLQLEQARHDPDYQRSRSVNCRALCGRGVLGRHDTTDIEDSNRGSHHEGKSNNHTILRHLFEGVRGVLEVAKVTQFLESLVS